MRKIAPLCYWLARRLHRVASFLNKSGYHFEHGVECGVIWDSPLARMQAEFRQSVRDSEFDPAQRLQSSLVVDRCEVCGQCREGLADEVDGHPLAGSSAINVHLVSSFRKFLDQRRGFSRPQGLSRDRSVATPAPIAAGNDVSIDARGDA
jgi:hypothetical protein